MRLTAIGAVAGHIRGCVANDIEIGDDETIDELVRIMQAYEIDREELDG